MTFHMISYVTVMCLCLQKEASSISSVKIIWSDVMTLTSNDPDIDHVVHTCCNHFPRAAPAHIRQGAVVQVHYRHILPLVEDAGLLQELMGLIGQTPHPHRAIICTVRTHNS